MAYGGTLIDTDVDRIGEVTALGLDETLFCRAGKWRTQHWCRSIVDVTPGHVQLLAAGNPRGEVRMAWHAKEVVRSIYADLAHDVAAEFVDQLGVDLQDDSCPPEVRSLGRTIVRWRDQIVAWHHTLVTNGPTEAVNNLIKRIKPSGSASDASRTTASACCSTPPSPTATYSPPSHPLISDEPHYRAWSCPCAVLGTLRPWGSA